VGVTLRLTGFVPSAELVRLLLPAPARHVAPGTTAYRFLV
jgi:hypothetical protein